MYRSHDPTVKSPQFVSGRRQGSILKSPQILSDSKHSHPAAQLAESPSINEWAQNNLNTHDLKRDEVTASRGKELSAKIFGDNIASEKTVSQAPAVGGGESSRFSSGGQVPPKM